jgi:hypothetical protein
MNWEAVGAIGEIVASPAPPCRKLFLERVLPLLLKLKTCKLVNMT